MYRKTLIFIFFSINLFAFNESKLRKELISNGLNFDSEAPIRYVAHMSVYIEGIGYTLPTVRLFDNKKAEGEPVYSISNSGFYKGSDLLCRAIIKQAEGKKGLTKRYTIDQECLKSPLTYDKSGGLKAQLLLLEGIDEKFKVAKIKIQGRYLYVKMSDFKGVKIKMPTYKALNMTLPQEDINQINSLLMRIRGFLKNKDYKKFENSVFLNKNKYSTLHGDYEEFVDFFSRKNIEKKIYLNTLLESTFLNILNYTDLDLMKSTLKNKYLCLETPQGNIRLCFIRENNQWFFYKYSLENILYL